MQKRRLKILYWVAGSAITVATLICIVVLGAFAWLKTNDGRSWLAATISTQASTPQYKVHIDSIKKLSARRFVISSLNIADREGRFIRLNQISVEYSPLALVKGQIHINRFDINTVQVDRRPAAGQQPQKQGQAPSIPSLPDMRVDAIRIGTIDLDQSITGSREKLSLKGHLAYPGELMGATFALKLRDMSSNRLLADIAFDLGNHDTTNLHARIHDAETGPLARMIGVSTIDLTIDGNADADGWRGYMRMALGEDFRAQHKIRFAPDARPSPLVTFQGKTSYAGLSADGTTKVRLKSEDGGADLTFAGNIHSPEARLHDIRASLGIKRGKGIVIEQARLDHDWLAAEIKGDVSLDKPEFRLSSSIDIPALGRFSDTLQGAGAIAADITGSYQPLTAQAPVKVTLKKLETPWPRLNTLLGREPVLKTDLSYTNQRLQISNGTLAAAGLGATGFDGVVTADKRAMTLATAYQDHKIRSDLQFQNGALVFDELRVDGPEISGQGSGRYHVNDNTLKAEFNIKPASSMQLAVGLSGPVNRLRAKGALTGDTSKHAYNFNYSGVLDTTGKPVFILQALDGDYGPNRIDLEKPTRLRWAEAKAHLDQLVMTIGKGRFVAEGAFGMSAFDLTLKADEMPTNLGLSPFVLDGQLNAQLSANGTYNNPVANAELTLTDLALPGGGETKTRMADGTMTVNYKDSHLTAQANLEGSQGLYLKGEADIPLSLSSMDIPFDRPLSARLDSRIDLDLVAMLLGLDVHRIQGQFNGNIAVAGTRNAPVVEGTGTLKNGVYQNLLTGTHLRDISATLQSDAKELKIRDLKGSDGNGGRFSGTATIRLGNIFNPDYTIRLNAKRLQLVNMDRIGLRASGSLTAKGDRQRSDVTGDIQVNHAEYYISEIVSTSSLDLFEIVDATETETETGTGTGTGTDTQTAIKQSTQPDSEIAFEVDLRANNSIFIRGPDLDTEWSGKLSLTGTLGEPALTGNMTLNRGRFQLLDTPVTLTKGKIDFVNPDPANPAIEIDGIIKGREMDTLLNITGEAQNPALKLSSDPPVPEDEILAKTLFGKSVDRLTPLESLRIARLMASLSGKQSATFDPVGKVRQTLGLDTLNVSMDENEGPGLSAGKYVSDRVFVGIDQGLAPGSSAIRTEIDITDDIELESLTGATGESSLGMNWKRDY